MPKTAVKPKTFTVEIQVSACAFVDVEADSADAAEEIAKTNFGNGDPLIDDQDYETEFHATLKS